MTPQRIYLAFTPYHLLLALAIQDRDGCPDAIVLFADEASILTHAPAIRVAVSKFVGLQNAPTLERYPAREYPVRCRLAARSALRFVRGGGVPAEIYTANGLRPESYRLFRALSGRTSFNFVEDGFDSYISVNRAEVADWQRTLHRVLCGSPRARSHDMIEAYPYQGYNVIAPDLCRAPRALVHGIPVDSLRRASEILESGMSLTPPDRAITDLYLLANSERMPDPMAYVDAMRSWVQSRVADDPAAYIAVKAHPREKSARLKAAVRELGDYLVPHWVPAELLTGLLSPRVSVHCGLTTFIVSSRQLLPERRLHLDQTVGAEHAAFLQRWDPAIEAAGTGAQP